MKLNVDENQALARVESEPQAARSRDHRDAKRCWSSRTDIARPDDAGLERIERLLRDEVLPPLADVRRALDVGCGDGRLSLVMAEFARSVLGIDIAAALIAQAQERAAEAGLTSAQFECRDAEAPLPEGPFDLISCHGMLSTLVDDAAYLALVARLDSSLRPGGWLLVTDTVCAEGAGVDRTGDVVVHHRSLEACRRSVMQQGLQAVREVEIARLAAGRAQVLWLWRKPSEGGRDDQAPDERGLASVVPDGRAVEAAPSVTLADLAAQQERQSEVLLEIGRFLLELGERLHGIEARLAESDLPGVRALPELLERLDRIERRLLLVPTRPDSIDRS